MFVNGIGSNVEIAGIDLIVKKPEGARLCTQWVVESSGGESVTNPDPGNTVVVEQGETFKLTGTGCSFPGDRYELDLSIDYHQDQGGFIFQRTDVGTLMGPIES